MDDAIRVTMLVHSHLSPDDTGATNHSAKNLHEAYPHLSLTQIYAGLFFYYDHKAELDAVMATEQAETEALLERMADKDTQARLRKLKEEWIASGRIRG